MLSIMNESFLQQFSFVVNNRDETIETLLNFNKNQFIAYFYSN